MTSHEPLPAEPVGWRVVLHVDADDAELVADRAFVLGALGIEETAGHSGDETVRLLVGMADEATAVVAAGSLGGEVEPIFDDGWADAWRAWARPVAVGSVLVQPAWLDAAMTPDIEHVISIEPGRAFGIGQHETTQLALGVLLEQCSRNATVLDIGCGTGVLSVAAAVAVDATAVAIDVDEHAVDVTRANVVRNGVEAAVTASSTSVADLQGQFDVVVANILAVTLRDLAADVARVVAADGVVVLSGMLRTDVGAVDAAYEAVGLYPLGERYQGDWAARWYRRRAS